jgi:hypothetical protein
MERDAFGHFLQQQTFLSVHLQTWMALVIGSLVVWFVYAATKRL